MIQAIWSKNKENNMNRIQSVQKRFRAFVWRNKNIMVAFGVGVILSASAVVYAASATDAWNIGNGWLFFKVTPQDGKVRANVSATPKEPNNIATKAYVDAAGGGVSTCVQTMSPVGTNVACGSYSPPSGGPSVNGSSVGLPAGCSSQFSVVGGTNSNNTSNYGCLVTTCCN